jgi:hypothetical protein
MSNGDDAVREQQENYPDEPFKPWPLGDAEVQMMVSPKVREKIVAMLLEREQTAFRAGQAAMQYRAAEECRILSLPLPPAPREDDFVRDFAHRASQNILALPLLESSDPRTFTELREQRIVQEQQKQAAGLAVEATGLTLTELPYLPNPNEYLVETAFARGRRDGYIVCQNALQRLMSRKLQAGQEIETLHEVVDCLAGVQPTGKVQPQKGA